MKSGLIKIGEVCSFLNGGTPSKSVERYFQGDIPWITGADISSPVVTTARSFITNEAVKSSATNRVSAGTVLLVTRTSVGKVATAGVDLCFSQDITALTPDASRLHSSYLVEFLKTQESHFQRKARGATIKGITRQVVSDLEILLPSLPEQRRIAAVLDQAEALRAKRRAALAELDTLTQAIFLDMFGDPARNTMRLPTISLGDLGEWSSGGTPPRSREDYFDGSIPWFSSGELNTMFVHESKEHVSTEALHETTAKAVPKGALMLGMYDTAALKASIAGVRCSCNQAIAFATINSTIAETVFVYFSIVIGREHFRRLQRGVRQKNLNLSMVREISIPRPTLKQQQEFTRHVIAIEKLKVSHRASLEELDALFTSLQHRAFCGKLEIANSGVFR